MSAVSGIPALATEHFAAVLDALAEGVVTVDRNYTITGFNSAAERITGLRRAEVLGRHCHEVFRSAACGTVNDCPMTLALRTGRVRGPRRLKMRDRDGVETLVLLTFHPLRDGTGRIVGGVETMQPLSQSAAPRGPLAAQPPGAAPAPDALPILEASERRAIEAVLREHAWNRTTAARGLGISRITLWRKMRKLGIPTVPPR